MKLASLTLAIFAITNSVAQGVLNFDNESLLDPVTQRLYRAPVTLPNGQGAEGSRFTAGLFLVQSQEPQLLATATFREGVLAGYFVPVFKVEVPGIPPGAPATFRARVWETAAGSYENAVASGEFYHGAFVTASGSELINVPVLASASGIPHGLRVPGLDGMQPLTLVPEPQTLFLLLLGTTFLITRKR